MEQEDYAKGFEDALKNLHDSNNEQQSQPTKVTTGASLNPSSTGMSGGGITTFSTDDANLMLPIKEEPQAHVEHDLQMNPIDMDSQEKIKLERKRQRNRVAASKCRKRKLGKIL